jgi:hypothetical protein
MSKAIFEKSDAKGHAIDVTVIDLSDDVAAMLEPVSKTEMDRMITEQFSGDVEILGYFTITVPDKLPGSEMVQ